MTFTPEAGALVGGRFRLVERLDSGGFATVWRATDEETGAAVALKCGSDAKHARGAVRERFRAELAAFQRLDGPLVPGSLVQFLDGAVDGDDAWVAVELLDGGALDGDPGVDWGAPALAAIGAPVCGALDFCHRHGVVHLDLKPDNVVLRERGPPAVVDFNAAVAAGEGSLLYHHDPFKPPELTPTDLREHPAGPRSDVYAVGALLAYLTTGEVHGHEGDAVADWAPIDPVDHADCPPDLAAAIRKATAPRPVDRFDDASELYAAVAPYLDPTGRVARVTHEASGRTVRVHPGATVGRWSPGEAVPDVVLDDPDRILSPEHAVLVARDEGWALRDRSLNGTHVLADGDHRFALSDWGADEQRAAGRDPPEAPELLELADGDRIEPVDTDLGFGLRFEVEV